MKDILYSLDKPPIDSISERLDREAITHKYWLNLGLAIILSVLTSLVAIFTLFKRSEPVVPITASVNQAKNKVSQIITLPFPHQSFQNVSGWVFDAIMSSYTFNFSNFDEAVEKSSYFYTPDGYKMYLNALEASKVKKDVLGKQLDVSIVPLQSPVLINSGVFGKTEFWRFGIPVLVSYYGGKVPVVQKQRIEVLVLRVPAYQNPKGLAISEFNMAPL